MLINIDDGTSEEYSSEVEAVQMHNSTTSSKPDDSDATSVPSEKPSEGGNEGQKQGQPQSGDMEKLKEQAKEIKEPFTFEDVDPGDVIVGQIKYSDKIIVDGAHPVFGKHLKDKKLRMQPNLDGTPRLKNIRMTRILPGAKLFKMGLDGTVAPKPTNVPDLIMEEFPNIGKYVAEVIGLIRAGIKNIWLVGPAGCGKSTICELVAEALKYPFYEISCGAGTSATEFKGFKYPEREATDFQNYYGKRSMILLDEFTALDPSVAQVANAALANGRLEITTEWQDTGKKLVHRDEDCIIIGTSNTFGAGASPVYVANNQLDASTRDRFIGGVIEVDYDPEYEAKFDASVVNYVNAIRKCMATHGISRVASTRMIISGESLKKMGYIDWAARLVTDWSKRDLKVLKDYLVEHKLPLTLSA